MPGVPGPGSLNPIGRPGGPVTEIIGRTEAGQSGDRADESDRPVAHLGHYRACDGSAGARLALDIDGPHAALVVGKRGYGKSYTLGVLAEELAQARGIAPVIVDPMGVFGSLATPECAAVAATIETDPSVDPASLGPRAWCSLLDLDPESGAGALVWQATRADTLDGMRALVADSSAPDAAKRAAQNHLDLAASYGVFDAAGIDAAALDTPGVTVVDVSGLDRAPMNAVARALCATLYRGRVDGRIDRLPWLLVDEAHAFFYGVSGAGLRRICTRGRGPGVSLVAATQRPSAIPEVAISQADLTIAHRLTAEADIDALGRARPVYMRESLADRMPTEPGAVLVVDDATEMVHTATIRERQTPHGGDDPSAREAAASLDGVDAPPETAPTPTQTD